MSTAKFILRLLDSLKTHEDKIAVVDQNGQRQTTYKELFTNACRVAGYLLEKNYPPHSFIGICLPSSMEYLASEIGIWLAGHAIVPMGDKYPQDRIESIMHHCESPLLINAEVIQAMMKTEPAENYILPDENDINALFYTSGSTGTPKGVLHNFCSLSRPIPLEKHLAELDLYIMGATMPFFFIASRTIFCIFFRGGHVCLIEPEIVKDIHQLEDYLALHHIEFTFLTPSLLANFQSKSSDLKLVMSAAERMTNIYFKDFKLINHYGQTETCGAGASFEVDKPYETTPIGKPGYHVEYCIMDQDGNKVPKGEEGEFCLKGNLTVGYYKDPEATAELYKYGWLHTGDIVRELPDGNLIYVNRKDWMVKINGQRVEPGELEAVIKQIEGISNAVVKGFTTENRQYLCAYYIASENISEDTIREHLLSKLPAYMVPAYFVRMESFPLLPSGKTDRQALLAPTIQTEGIVRPPYAEPTNHVERQLCEAFEKTLSVDHVGIDDDFFELGGDSIRVMEVQTLCPDLQLSSQMIYVNRTPRRIAEACVHTESVRYTQQNDYPLSQTQLGIFVECMSRQGEVAYNNGMLFQLNPAIDANRLSKACETVVKAHPYIKTRLFVDSQGYPRQLRNDAETYHQSVETFTLQEFEKLKPELIRPFDLLNDRLFRIRIIKTPDEQYLFMDFHHIIFDGVSYNILLQDLIDAYEQLQVKREEFAGYEVALEEESLRKTEAYTSARKWYKEQFETLKVSSLPTPEKQDSNITYGQEHLELTVDHNQLQEAAEYFGVTANVLTTTVFGYLLGVNTHAQESLFATIFSGRQDLKTQRTIAMLVKTLPVYTRWNENTTVHDLLQTTKQQLIGSMSNSLFSFAEVKAMNDAINSHVLFAYQGDLKQSDSELFTYQPLMENATGENLAFEILRSGTKLILHAEYHSNQYTQSFIQRLMRCYNTILEGFLNTKSEDKRLCKLPILTDEEQQAILALGTGDHLEYDKTETVVDLFHRQAILTPNNIAVVDEVSKITYAELDRRSDFLATTLRNAGVKKDTFVAIMLPRRKEFLMAVFAVFKAGGAYIPLDSDYPKERLVYLLNDSNAQVLITTRTLLEDCQTEQYFPRERHLLIDGFDFNDPSVHPVNFAQPTGLAYMIYTSGTTGKPKGVMITHEAILNFFLWLKDTEELKAGEQCAIHTNFVFDGSMFDLYPPLISGATLHILSSSLRMDLPGMCHYFKEQQITGLLLTTQIGMTMMGEYELPLRFLMVGGEKLTDFRMPSSMKLYNCYGPTEFAVCSSFYQIDNQRQYNNIPIGRPAPNTLSVIIDTEGRLVPQGTVGELCLIGHQMSRGYWNQEEQTMKRFVDCSFLSGQKMYRTGDLVRWNEEGLLEYIGRIDNQVKLHGYRIELEEIESKMNHCPGVISAAVVVNKQGDLEFLVGYYTSEDNQELSGIQETLMAELPGYMVPSQLIRLDQMPLTPNGKIDRKALPTPIMNQAEVVKPDTTMEKQVFDIVSEQLKTSQFGVTDNLVFYGLSSLSAMRLAVVLDNRLDVRIRMADIMKAPTVRAIAAKLEKSEQTNILRPYAPQTFYPLMENQRGLYLEWEKNRDTTQYNMPSAYRFHGADADRMVHALRQTVDAHCYMKTRLTNKDGKLVLERHDDEAIEIAKTVSDVEPTINDFQQRVRPFQLLDQPLFRIEVISAPDNLFLFFDAHHIIFDGMSRNIFMNDLKRAYDGKPFEQESYMAFDHALYEQNELRDTEKMREAEIWYDEMLADANEIIIPSFSTPDGIDYAKVEVTLPRHEIDTFCAANGVTVNSYMHAAFAIVIKRLIKEENPLYLTISSGRDIGPELQRCIGMFVTTLPIVITSEMVKSQTNAEYVKEVHKRLQKFYSMDYYPYTHIVEKHRVNAGLMFLFQGGLNDNSLWNDIEQIPLSLDTPKFPLSIIVTPNNDNYLITLEYDGKRYCHQVMLQGIKALRNVFLNMALTATVREVELISLKEESELLELGKGETIHYDSFETIVDLFHRQAMLRPDNIAVVDEVSEITYAELDRRSDLLATALRKAGVDTDCFVAIMLPRRKEFLVAMLAVFKAGGAYIPLDSDYPKERLAFMLNNSDAHILITTGTLANDCQTKQYFPRENQLLMDDFDFNEPSDHPVNFAQPSGLAYMIYTSGTTGMPKGVMIEHQSLRAYLAWHESQLKISPEEHCALHSSFSFDASLDDLLPPLIQGAQIHILSSELRHNIQEMNDYFIRHNISGLTLSTQLGIEMLKNYQLPLRYLLLGGSKMSKVPIGNTRVINGYGPTEFTVCSSYYTLEQDENHENIPIGRPVPNSISVVVDTEGHLVPQGIVGELCLIGHQMSRGYWKQEELTKKHFVDCSFLSGHKMYRTGDLVRWNDEGLLEYIGRIDNQVKLHGYRIELEEIENKISQCPGVISTAVVVYKQGNVECLVAYYTSEGNKELLDIKRTLMVELPSYMVPSQLIRIDQMPKTPNGKIDRRQLKGHVSSLRVGTGALVVPSSQKEQVLLDLAKTLLGDDIGVTDDLTLLGLSSLDAIRLSSLARHEGLDIKVNDILRNKSIRNILESDQSIGKWENAYDGSKPVIVLIQGFTYFKKLEPLISKLRQHYSVFVIEPIDDHYEAIFNEEKLSSRDVVKFYIDYLEVCIPSNANIKMFIGHSFGGELAYRCAVRWHKKKNTMPKVCMFDTFANAANIAKEMPIPQLENLTPDEEIEIEEVKEWNRHLQQILALKDDCDLPGYDGDVLYFAADILAMKQNFNYMDEHDLEKKKQEDLNCWKSLVPSMSIYPVAADHFTMLEDRFCDDYIVKIDDIVLPHNS